MTLYVDLGTGAFGLSAAAVRAFLPHVSFPDDADLTEHGFASYALTPLPDAGWWQTITETTPADGQQAWEVSDRPLPDVRAAWSDRVTAKRDAAFAGGYAPTTGALAGQTLQVRDDRDKINWLTSQASYLAAMQGGHGAVPGATFRTAANDTIITSYAEGFQIIVVGMAQWGAAIMNRSWALKDEGAAAETLTETAGHRHRNGLAVKIVGHATVALLAALAQRGLSPEEVHDALVDEAERRNPGSAVILQKAASGGGFDLIAL